MIAMSDFSLRGFMIRETWGQLCRGDDMAIVMFSLSLLQIGLLVYLLIRGVTVYRLKFLRQCILIHYLAALTYVLFGGYSYFFNIDGEEFTSAPRPYSLGVVDMLLDISMWLLIPPVVYAVSVLLELVTHWKHKGKPETIA
jgi:hypothetical protein